MVANGQPQSRRRLFKRGSEILEMARREVFRGFMGYKNAKINTEIQVRA
jgi:hypothetical protein